MQLNKFKQIKKLKKLVKKIYWIKKILGYNARDSAIINGSPIILQGYTLRNHDIYHLEIAQLERIQIGKYMVSGIHGINSSVFHDFPITEEYESFLDEARVAFHEWLTRPSLINTIKTFIWMNWLTFNGINSFAVLYRHYKSLSRYIETNNSFPICPRGFGGGQSPIGQKNISNRAGNKL